MAPDDFLVLWLVTFGIAPVAPRTVIDSGIMVGSGKAFSTAKEYGWVYWDDTISKWQITEAGVKHLGEANVPA